MNCICVSLALWGKCCSHLFNNLAFATDISYKILPKEIYVVNVLRKKKSELLVVKFIQTLW